MNCGEWGLQKEIMSTIYHLLFLEFCAGYLKKILESMSYSRTGMCTSA